MTSRRPRRSRIYDSNYNIGENYYKSAIDRLDEKYSRPSSILTRHSEPPAVSPPRRYVAVHDDEDLETARDRASRAIQKETVLDTRSSRKGIELESSFDGQVQKTLERIQASKKLLNTIDDTFDSNEASSTKVYKKRTTKVDSSVAASNTNELTKWSNMTDYNDSESYAAVRARQSAARIQDIENDMYQREQRQFAREARSANVKKVLADSDFESGSALTNGVASMKITKTTRKQVTTY